MKALGCMLDAAFSVLIFSLVLLHVLPVWVGVAVWMLGLVVEVTAGVRPRGGSDA